MRSRYFLSVIFSCWFIAMVTLSQDQLNNINYQSRVANNETTSAAPVGYGYQNHGPYIAEDRIWVFYSDGENAVWRTRYLNEDAVWSEKSVAFNETDGSFFEVAFDGVYFHFIRTINDQDNGWGDLEYMRAKANRDGTLTFDNPILIFSDPDWKASNRHFSIYIDHSKKPWVVAKVRNEGINRYKAIALSSIATNGTWQNRPGFPKDLNNMTSLEINGRGNNIIEIAEGQILFTWRNHETDNSGMRARLWSSTPGNPNAEGNLGPIELTGIGQAPQASSSNTSVVSPELFIVLLNSNTMVSRRNSNGTWQLVTPPAGLNEVISNSMTLHNGAVRLWDHDGQNIRYRETSDNGTSWSEIVSKWSSPSPNYITATNPIGSWASHHSVLWKSGNSPYSVFMGIEGTIPQPEAPNLVSPADQATFFVDDVMEFSWNSVYFAGPYDFQIATDAAFNEIRVDISSINDTTITINDLENNRNYYWRVRATNVVGGPESEWSNIWEFNTVGPVSNPVLLLPEDGTESRPTSFTFIWEESAGAVTYQLQVATSSDFATTFVDAENIPDPEYPISGLDFAREYFWRVRAFNEFGSSGWSDVWSFTTQIAAPEAPTLVSPEDDSADVQTSLQISWEASPTAATYRLQISKQSNFASTVINVGNITNTSYDVTGLEHSTTYYWRVNATNESGTGAWSTVWSFTTIIATPDIPTLLSPVIGSESVSTFPVLRWDISSRAETYRLQVATNNQFTNVVFDQSELDSTQYTFVEELDEFTTYYWRVNATNIGGTSEWSSISHFTTDEAVPVAPILVGPDDGTTNVTNATMLWNSVPTATGYRLQVSKEVDFSTTTVDRDDITNTFFQATNLEKWTTYYWRVRGVSRVGQGYWSNVRSYETGDIVSVELIDDQIPSEFALEQNYPNPFNPETTIRFALPTESNVRLEIYNMLGQRIATLIDGEYHTAGTYQAQWDARDNLGRVVSSGIYIYRITAGDFVGTKKMTVMK